MNKFIHNFSEDYTDNVYKIVFPHLNDCNIGEIYIECFESTILSINNHILSKNSDSYEGFSVRKIIDERTDFQFSHDISISNIKSFCKNNYDSLSSLSKIHTEDYYPTYSQIVPINEQIELINDLNKYLYSFPEVRNANISLIHSQKDILIINNLGDCVIDHRPLLRLRIFISCESEGKVEQSFDALSGRFSYNEILKNGMRIADEAIRQARVALRAKLGQAGTFPVVLGPGCGVFLHEAIGHGLEADFHSKKISAFSGKLGTEISKKGVTIIDDGTIPFMNGSINFSDEGTISKKTILVEDGILKNLICDRFYSKKTGLKDTGNGRRESYQDLPYPRMTNTYMLDGEKTLEQITEQVNKGIYISALGGGQVDIVTGEFSFESAEAYEIINGEIGEPIKSCNISGSGIESLKNIVEVGKNGVLNPKGGFCIKNGQAVPVSEGIPPILLEKMIVGGSSL